MPDTKTDELIGVYDAAKILGNSCSDVRRLIRRKVLGYTTMPGGKKFWLSLATVLEYKAMLLKKAKESNKADADKAALYQMWLDL